MVGAGVLALLIVGALVWGGWYFFIYYPPMHNMESDFSVSKDGYDRADQNYERDKAAGKGEDVNVLSSHFRKLTFHANEVDRVRDEFRAKYGRSPRYLKPGERY